ncbi:unnamed protein product [Ilex paraguariensis]|uniref:Uncharacterized protein n=1 Tax=Ilex paraguariensis TaxID=185542 RepID=A0ABC8T8F4_9AQUA
MSDGGSKPRAGKMGTSIRASSISEEAIASAENELSVMIEKLSNTRKRIADAVQHYQATEKAISHMEMELANSQKELIDQDRAKHDYEQLKKTVDELRASDQNVELVKELKLRKKELEGAVGESTKDSDVFKRVPQIAVVVIDVDVADGDAVVNVYINHEKKFAFVEMRSVEEASNAMALDGILFEEPHLLQRGFGDIFCISTHYGESPLSYKHAKTLVQYQLPMVIIVFNNSGVYGGDWRNPEEITGPYKDDPAPTSFVPGAGYHLLIEAFGGGVILLGHLMNSNRRFLKLFLHERLMS